jgi:5'-3' exonuclease
MSKSVLFDYNNLCFRCFFTGDVNATSGLPEYAMWRYLVTTSLLEPLNKDNSVNEIVVAVDNAGSWRKDYYSRYKENRSVNRSKQIEVDWDTFFYEMDLLKSEISEYLPLKVIKAPKAEADDVIGVLSKYIDNDMIIINSNDRDYLQLCSDKIKLWNPSKRAFEECDDPKKFLVEQCLMGQTKDNIFNVKTPTDWGLTKQTEGKRKPGLGPKTVEKIMEIGYEKWLKDNNLEENFKRNRVLIDFDYIPQTIQKVIKHKYDKYVLPEPKNMYYFFEKHDMRGFMDEFDKLEYKLLRLY